METQSIRILRRHEVMAKTGLRETQLKRLESQGRFPKRRRISDRAVGWLGHEVDEWLLSRPLGADVRPDAAGDLPKRAA